MFVRHIRRHWEQNGGEHVFHCAHYRIAQEEVREGVLLMMIDNGRFCFEVVKETDQVYIMNDKGQTIDSYVWNQEKPQSASTKAGDWKVKEG